MISTVKVLPIFLIVAVASAFAAGPWSARFPPGSIQTREQADEAVRAVKAESDAVKRNYADEAAKCNAKILVNRCEEQARARRDQQLHEIERTHIEADDLVRKLDAEERARRRAEEEARRKQDEQARLEREAKSRAEYEARQKDAETSAKQDTRAGKATSPKGPRAAPASGAPNLPKKPRAPHAPALVEQDVPGSHLTEAQRAENQRRYEEKQKQAEEYARKKAAEREDHERSREKRKKEQEADAARRAAAKKPSP
jgi:hypothetical protein